MKWHSVYLPCSKVGFDATTYCLKIVLTTSPLTLSVKGHGVQNKATSLLVAALEKHLAEFLHLRRLDKKLATLSTVFFHYDFKNVILMQKTFGLFTHLKWECEQGDYLIDLICSF